MRKYQEGAKLTFSKNKKRQSNKTTLRNKMITELIITIETSFPRTQTEGLFPPQ